MSASSAPRTLPTSCVTAANTSAAGTPRATSVATRRNAACSSASTRSSSRLEAFALARVSASRVRRAARPTTELTALAKANPGKYSFASSGSGTSPHLSGEIYKQLAGLNLLHVPYRGSAPAYQDLLAGQVDMMFDNIPGPLGLMRSGKVRGLAVTSKERHPAAPEIPAMAEFLPGFEITSWGGVCGPAGLPPAMVEKLSALTRKALDSAPVKVSFEQQGATAIWMNPADTAAYRATDEKRLAPVIKASGAKVD